MWTIKMYHANSGVNRMYNQGRKLTTVKHKCYAEITMQYILKMPLFLLFPGESRDIHNINLYKKGKIRI